jgi:hypothetical protein
MTIGYFFFCLFDVGEEEHTHGGFVEDHLSAVDSSRDMVNGVLLKLPVMPHAL